MALVSPGISISINDQSQYVNSTVGSVPLVVLATAQDKTYNGAPATGTTKAKAGALLSFSSQRDLVTQMGTPMFQLASDGTPVNGDETNEYGLLAAYSALGLTNQVYAIRADIDLDQLTGTAVRPQGEPADGTYWFDTVNTTWGINSLDAVAGQFNSVTPLILTSTSQVTTQVVNGNTIYVPLSSVGNIGQYALVTVPNSSSAAYIRLFYKRGPNSYTGTVASNQWVLVGSPDWQTSLPVVTGTVSAPIIPTSSTLTINTVTVTSDGTVTTISGINGLAAKINSAAIPGVYANVSTNGRLQLFATSAATSTGGVADGKIVLVDGTNNPLATAGITVKPYYCPYLFYGSYAASPTGGWFASDSQPRPSGSIWWKTSALGGGWNPVFKRYDASLMQWDVLSPSMYSNYTTAIYGLDPNGGGININHGQTIALYNPFLNTYNALRLAVQLPGTTSSTTGGAFGSVSVGNTFTINATASGSTTNLAYPITLSGTTAQSFVSDILAANIPYVTASVNSSNEITVTHTAGGQITLTNTTVGSNVLTNAGFTVASDGNLYITNFSFITYETNFEANAPYSAPAAGTLWYNSDAIDVDIMINNNGWKGYQVAGTDVRGYALGSTDPMGVIVTPTTAPTSQSDGTPLVAGDLWLDSGDLVNYPSLYRYTGSTWVAIDNTDHTSSNGIIFADARWDTTGTTDIITGAIPSVQSLLSSNYIDQDAPDYRLYPRGTLLFNTRRTGYNVKKFVPGYFNSASFPVTPAVPGASSSLPTIKDAWVTESGLDDTGVMYSGSRAQRNVVVGAMQSAIDSNLDALSTLFQFNLLVAPNYPEVVPNLLTLNANRGSTAFVISDTPMDLAPNAVDIGNWNNGITTKWESNGAYNTSTSPYLAIYYSAGRTNDLAGNQVVVPASHAVLRTYLYNDQVAYPWFAPAGTQRGLVSNISDIGYINSAGSFVHNAVNQGLRDSLATFAINPITQLPGSGIAVWGQLTRSGSTTARNRVNVVRLENYLRTIFQTVANGYLFEPNDAQTRKSIAAAVSGSLNTVLAHRGLYDFLVICDTSNNTSATIANNQLYVDVAIEPERDVEFIYIPIAIYNPGTIATLK